MVRAFLLLSVFVFALGCNPAGSRATNHPRISGQTTWLTLLFVTGFSAVMWRNHRRVTRINRELRDLNERLEAEMEASRASQKIRASLELRVARAERMESLGALAGGISHDFNNLLVGVVCNAQLLKRPDLTEEARERCIDGILQSADKATDLSRKMRAYAGREPSSRRAADLVALVNRLRPILESTFMDGREVRFEFEAEKLLALIDEAQVETILMSLARNARDAFDSSLGQVTIRVGTETIDDVANDSELVGERSGGGDFVFVDVEDTGRGLSSEELGRMFEPFFTTKDGGRGMGLAVVYGLVNRQDGLIRCSSRPGMGTKMRILLPKASGTEKAAPKTKELGRLPKRGRLVVVDDEQSILDVISQAFKTFEWTTENFSSGISAISFIEQNTDKIDCIILDVVMPEMGGEAIVKQLNERGIRVPIVMMSGFSSTNLNDLVSLPNVQATLNKPFSVADLVDAVNIAIASTNKTHKIK